MVSFKHTAKDGTKLLFREPGPRDAPQLMRFINAFVAEKRSGLLINKKVKLSEEKAWLRSWRGMIKRGRGVMLLAEMDGRIVGSCTVNLLPWKSSHVGDTGIALSREVRGIGVGEALMSKTIELARKRMSGLEMLLLKAFDYNDRARALYCKMGFVQVGKVPRANKEGDEYHDDILMVKFL